MVDDAVRPDGDGGRAGEPSTERTAGSVRGSVLLLITVGLVALAAGGVIGWFAAPDEEIPGVPEPCERTLRVAEQIGSEAMDTAEAAMSALEAGGEEAATSELGERTARLRALNAHLRSVEELCAEARAG